jgi:hypothetical protein
MAVSLTKPTVNGDNGTWGATLNAALDQVNDYDRFAYKTADESLTSSTTLQDDDHLLVPLAVGTYVVQAAYRVSGAAAGDVKIGWAFSGTATGYREGVGPSVATADVLAAAVAQPVRAATAGTGSDFATAVPYGVDGTNYSAVLESAVMVVTVAGTLKVQWAQNASSATATIVRQGSSLWARRVI